MQKGKTVMCAIWQDERFSEFAYFRTNKLACCNFIDVSRRHSTPGSETKDFTDHATAACGEL